MTQKVCRISQQQTNSLWHEKDNITSNTQIHNSSDQIIQFQPFYTLITKNCLICVSSCIYCCHKYVTCQMINWKNYHLMKYNLSTWDVVYCITNQQIIPIPSSSFWLSVIITSCLSDFASNLLVTNGTIYMYSGRLQIIQYPLGTKHVRCS